MSEIKLGDRVRFGTKEAKVWLIRPDVVQVIFDGFPAGTCLPFPPSYFFEHFEKIEPPKPTNKEVWEATPIGGQIYAQKGHTEGTIVKVGPDDYVDVYDSLDFHAEEWDGWTFEPIETSE